MFVGLGFTLSFVKLQKHRNFRRGFVYERIHTRHCSSHHQDLGFRKPMLEGEEYLSIVDEFVEAIHRHWPKAIVQCISQTKGGESIHGAAFSDEFHSRVRFNYRG